MQKYFTGSIPLYTPNHSFEHWGGPEALPSTTFFFILVKD